VRNFYGAPLSSMNNSKCKCRQNANSDVVTYCCSYACSATNQGFFFLALQPSAGYGFLWLCSPAQTMASCSSAAQRRLWPPVALQPSAGYGLLWLCSPAQAMASCSSAAQRGLWPPVALQPSAGYGLLVSHGFLLTHNDAPQ
jgi:hypothetical protein